MLKCISKQTFSIEYVVAIHLQFLKRFFFQSTRVIVNYLKKLKAVTLIFKAASYWQNLINKPTYLVLLKIYFLSVYKLFWYQALYYYLSHHADVSIVFLQKILSVYKNYYLHVYLFLFL